MIVPDLAISIDQASGALGVPSTNSRLVCPGSARNQADQNNVYIDTDFKLTLNEIKRVVDWQC